MDNNTQLAQDFLDELESEVLATRKCIERVPENLYKWKPHEKSMEMGYLALLAADIPKWIATIIEEGKIDFATWERYELTTPEELVKYFEKNLEKARNALKNISAEKWEETFSLQNNGTLLASDSKKKSVSSSLNHWVHHRGQLTVYMRLNNIPVPSIYGPSADDISF